MLGVILLSAWVYILYPCLIRRRWEVGDVSTVKEPASKRQSSEPAPGFLTPEFSASPSAPAASGPGLLTPFPSSPHSELACRLEVLVFAFKIQVYRIKFILRVWYFIIVGLYESALVAFFPFPPSPLPASLLPVAAPPILMFCYMYLDYVCTLGKP